MAVDNIKEFSVQWILFGLLLFCLLSFAITFVYNNNPTALGGSSSIFETVQSNLSSKLVETEDSANALLNITAETDPEVSDLGSMDSVATSYGTTGTAKGFFEISKIFISWVITGTAGQILVAVFGGIFGLLMLYFIIKSIRNGL